MRLRGLEKSFCNAAGIEMSSVVDDQEFRVPFPLELVIGRTPLSAQASNPRARHEWKNTVGGSARERINSTRELYFLDDRPLMATIFYFPPTRMVGDMDNVVKPILDALTHIAYPDDRCIERILVQKFEPGVSWSFVSPSAALESAINMEKPALYIRLDDDLEWRIVS